jgi:hypothetical protein
MPILIIILLAVIIAQVGFWDTLGGLLGAAAMMLLFVLLLAATVALVAYWLFRRVRGRF